MAQWLEDLADNGDPPVETGGERLPEFRRLAIDVSVEVGLGRFFGAKLRSGVLYAIHERTGDRAALEEALKQYRRARDSWAEIADRTKGVYVPDVTVGELPWLRGHWLDRLPAIDDDIADMQKRLESAKAASEPAARAAIAEALGRPRRASAACRHTPPAQFHPSQPLDLEIAVERKLASARLYYRHVNQAERYQTAEMQAAGNRYRAAIPGAYTDSPFPLQYYFELKEAAGQGLVASGIRAGPVEPAVLRGEAARMKYRTLGRTGWQVSEVSFGAWAIGGSWGSVDDRESLAALESAIDCGVNFIDTSDVYGMGRSERLLAQLKRARKEEIVIATKTGKRLSPQTADGYNEKNLTAFIEDSLRNLGTDCLDLVQLHCPPPDVYYRPEVFGVLDRLMEAGKIRHYGVSVKRVEEGLKAIEYPNVQTVQIIFNCFRHRPAELFFGQARQKQVGILARVPLASGMLTGKLTRQSQFDPDDHRQFNRHGEAFDVGETFSGVDYEAALEAVEEMRARGSVRSQPGCNSPCAGF